MPATKTPDPLTRVTTKRDGKEGRTIVAEGTPLYRLQAAHDDPDAGAYAGDVADVLAQCDSKDDVAVKLGKLIKGKSKGERVAIEPADVAHLTNLFNAAAN